MSKAPAKQAPLSGEALRSAITDFRNQHHSVLISSTAPDGTPDASYAPYISDLQQQLYIFVSRLAAHTDNLLHSGRASLLFIRDEQRSSNLFARQRLIYQCTVNEIPSGSDEFTPLLAQMSEQFGAIINTLRQLPDFHLLRLTPTSGRYIEGFGKAYQWQGGLPDDGEHHQTTGTRQNPPGSTPNL